MMDCMCVCVCVKAHANEQYLCVKNDFLVGEAGVQREHEDGVPARTKPPLREFSVEIHQHSLRSVWAKTI